MSTLLSEGIMNANSATSAITITATPIPPKIIAFFTPGDMG